MNKITSVSVALAFISAVIAYLYTMKNKTAIPMAKTGLFLVSSVTKAQTCLRQASKIVNKVLYIKVNNSSDLLPALSKQIVSVYTKATTQCKNIDVRLILKPIDATKKIFTNNPVDTVFYDQLMEGDINKITDSFTSLGVKSNLHKIELEDVVISNTDNESVKTYNYVVVGGTFDRLHNGHKILLSQAALRTNKMLTVGVTDVNMIKSKKLWELILPVEQRIKSVIEFLSDINPDIEYNVLPIQDMYGPTKDDPKFQLLVVSEETIRGTEKINAKRAEKGYPPLDSFVVDLAEDSQKAEEEEGKVSSSNQRMRLLGTTLRPPMPNPNIPDWPYVIGLCGGIASGKSNIAEKLSVKGAAVVNCDLIAHELYKPGLPLNATLAENFGKHIILENGEVDRRTLGQIVFNDKEQLEKLNSLVWPAVVDEARRRIRSFGEKGYKVVVMEAAVMIRANWYQYCHQLWTVIVPPEEAIKRIQKRNNLPEHEARQRVQSQPPNSEQVALANVVFSPYWSYEYTQMQVDKAWDQLQELLNNRKRTGESHL